MQEKHNKTVNPSRTLSGDITVPGDKSVSHRSVMLSAIADGDSIIKGFLQSEDCVNTLKAVGKMGVKSQITGDVINISGCSGQMQKPENILDMGNSGTGMRLMAGLLATQDFSADMTGDASLRSRPMKRIKEPLDLMGAKVELMGPNGCAPVRITGGNLKAINYKLPVASAQVKSCVLFAGLMADGNTVVTEPRATRDHTELLLKAMNAPISVNGLEIRLKGSCGRSPHLKAGEWLIPGDISSAAFWMVAAACLPGSDVYIRNVGLNPRRSAIIDVLLRMGADIEVTPSNSKMLLEPCGDVRIRGTSLKATEVEGAEIPNIIDEIPILSVAASLATGSTVIRDAAELRVKESDRIATMVKNLSSFGVSVEEKNDGMVIHGGAKIRTGKSVDSHGDHRVAMSMAILTLFADDLCVINDTACVATSYPTFWDHLKTLTN